MNTGRRQRDDDIDKNEANIKHPTVASNGESDHRSSYIPMLVIHSNGATKTIWTKPQDKKATALAE